MYEFVHESEYCQYREYCSGILKTVCVLLKEKGISAQFTLIGSGARNMVTRNGNGPYDLDYNLIIVKALDEYWKNPRRLKETVRLALNQSAKPNRFDDAQDSTSCLSVILHYDDTPEIEFKFDVGIIWKMPDSDDVRLIHNKNVLPNGQFIWNKVPQSRNLKEKERILKKDNLWEDVRNQYLALKKMYLSRQDRNHPSFVVYVEAVNQVYDKHYLHLRRVGL